MNADYPPLRCGTVHPLYNVPCSKEMHHSGSHGYDDGKGGVSWDNVTPDFPSVIAYNKQKARERRERIATAVLAGFYAGPETTRSYVGAAVQAVRAADALIAELDKGGT